jgi:pimeloyl-ACP methyl ester carboxylesterase
MEAARKGLGYERVNLFSGSYGTRLAMIYAWMHPESIHRSVMTAVNTPGRMVWEPDVIDAQIAYDAELCAQDADCSARTDDLAETMRNVAHNIPRRWLFLPIDPGKVRFTTYAMLFHRGSAAVVYNAYLAAEEGDFSGLWLMSLMYDSSLPPKAWGDQFTKGSIDFDPSRDYNAVIFPPDSILGAPLNLPWPAIQASDWPIPSYPEELTQVQPSDVETLMVSGSIDYSVPSRWATEELLPKLSNGQQVILSEFGHTGDFRKYQPEARIHMLTTFYDTGEVDDSLYTYQPMDFSVDTLMNDFPKFAKLIVAVIVLVIVLLVALVWFIVRRVRRRRAA